MSSPRLLDAQLLCDFEGRLVAQGVPAVGAARPGLTDEEMDALTSPIGILLPDEARLWWSWHDGVDPSVGAGPREIAPGRKWLPLLEALAERERILQMNSDVFAGNEREASAWWSSSWLPLIHSESVIAIDTSVSSTAACPVWVHLFYERPVAPDLASLGQMIELWIEAMDRHAWRYDRDEDHWCVDHSVLESWWAAKRGLV